MCSRFRGLREWGAIARKIAIAHVPVNFDYNPNVAPTEHVPAFLAEAGRGVRTMLARFGINLPAAKGKKRPPLLNARTDALRRGSFKSMLTRRHCVIPAEGFYEWREEDGKKQPYFFERKDGKPILFAGIWDYSDVKGDEVASFAILTDEPNELVAPYHDRMPVALENPEEWLDVATPIEGIAALGPDQFRVRRVNPAVNKVKEKDLEVIERVT
jgi:putative SOS response-associated peptidase YedK